MYSKLRERLQEEACEAQTWLLMNHKKVVNPEKVAAEAAKAAERRGKKRAKAEQAFDALVQKRLRA